MGYTVILRGYVVKFPKGGFAKTSSGKLYIKTKRHGDTLGKFNWDNVSGYIEGDADIEKVREDNSL